MRRLAPFVALLLVACPGPPGASDGGALDAGRRTPQPCRDDRACDDSRFCNGVERCRPDDPRATAFGCVGGERPCEVGVGCLEDIDACAGPLFPVDCEMRQDGCLAPGDCDGDGYLSVRCGGDDCEDTDRRVNPGAPEVCNDFDEDCDLTTLGPDGDGDGATRPECCNPLADGTLRCGRDCDDADPARAGELMERCNGLDDDCDDLVDEAFECLDGAVSTLDGPCGRPVEHTCDATCAWQRTGGETAATCDYCADGASLDLERPVATESVARPLDDAALFGDATRSCASCAVTLAADVPGVGGAFLAEAIRGHGPVTVAATVDATALDADPTGAWAIVVYQTASEDPLGRLSARGIDEHAGGWAVWWRVTGVDTIRFERVLPERADAVLTGSNVGAPLDEVGTARQTMTVVLDEARITGAFPCHDPDTCGDEGTVECAGALSCRGAVDPGSPIRVGVVAVTEEGDVRFSLTDLRVTYEGLCPDP